MNLQHILDKISKGDLEEALQLLIPQLEQTSNDQRSWLKAARLTQAELSQHREQVISGVISTEEDRLAQNRITKRLLDLVEAIQQGKPFGEAASVKTSNMSKWAIPLASLVVLIVAGLIWKLLPSTNGPLPPDVPQEAEPQATSQPLVCPTFSGRSTCRVAILPFLRMVGDDAPVDIGLMDEINQLCRMEGFSGQADLVRNFDIQRVYPNFFLADSLRNTCGTELMVWGKYYNSPSGQLRVDIRFVSNLFAAAQAQNIDSLLEMRNQGSLSASIRDAASLLLAHIFLANNQPEKSKAYAENVVNHQEPGDTSLAARMVLAESLRRLGDLSAATSVYDKMVALQPENSSLLTNRSILYYQDGKFQEALKDVNVAKEISPEKAANYRVESKIYETLGERTKSMESLEAARQKDIISNTRIIKRNQ